MSEAVGKSLEDAIKERKKAEGPSKKQGAKSLATRRTGNRRTGRPQKGKDAGGDKNKAQRVQRKTFKKPAAGATGKFIRRTRAGGKANERPQKRQQPRDRKRIETNAPKVEKRRLRVSNLDFNISHKDLMDLFSKFGSLTKNKIEYDDLGRSKGNAIIEYEKEDSANRAIEEYDGATLDGKTLSVEIDKPVGNKVPSVKKKVISKRDVPAKQGGQGRDRRREGGRRDIRRDDRRDDRRDNRRNDRNDRNRSESNRGGNKGNRQGGNDRRGGDNNRRGGDNNRRGGDNKRRDNNRRGGEKRNNNNNNNNRFRNRNRSDNKKNLGDKKSS